MLGGFVEWSSMSGSVKAGRGSPGSSLRKFASRRFEGRTSGPIGSIRTSALFHCFLSLRVEAALSLSTVQLTGSSDARKSEPAVFDKIFEHLSFSCLTAWTFPGLSWFRCNKRFGL